MGGLLLFLTKKKVNQIIQNFKQNFEQKFKQKFKKRLLSTPNAHASVPTKREKKEKKQRETEREKQRQKREREREGYSPPRGCWHTVICSLFFYYHNKPKI